MPLTGCTNGLVVTAVITLLLLPAHYYIPEFNLGTNEPLPDAKQLLRLPVTANITHSWLPTLDLPPADLFLTVSLIIVSLITYICDWIQRKLMERRIIKLNQYLGECVDQLRAWDVRQEELETNLQVVQNATTEYNLLLHLLLRQYRISPTTRKHSASTDYFLDKELDV